MAFRKLTWTKYSAYKILWLVSLQIHQNLNTLHQYSKNYIGCQSNNASITNCVCLHIKHFKFSNLPIFTIVFLFLLTLCLQDHLIHRFCPFHISEHLWVKGSFLSLLQDSGTLSHRPPDLFLHSTQNPSFQVSLPLWILSHPIIGLPYRMMPGIRHRALEVYYYYYYYYRSKVKVKTGYLLLLCILKCSQAVHRAPANSNLHIIDYIAEL